MAHNLRIVNGGSSMFYVGEPPWRGLGTQLKGPATAAEAIKAAGLDWTVAKKPLFATDGTVLHSVPERYVVVPEDRWRKAECPIFGIVGEEYTPLQNREAFKFFDPIAGEGAAIYDTAGALGDGERIWLLAKLQGHIRVVDEDVTEKYLLLSNSHDGHSSVQVKFTPIRVLCQNTLTMVLRKGPTVRVEHRKDLRERLAAAHELLGIVSKHFDDLGAAFQAMANVQMSGDHLSEYLSLVFPDPKDPGDERALKRARDSRLWSSYFFENGEGNGLPGVSGTLWAAYNGVTEFIDHRRTNQSEDRRLESIWFGSGYLAKARAFTIAEERMSDWAS